MKDYLKVDNNYCGVAEELLKQIEPNSIAVGVCSPPYHVGKQYETGQTYEQWLKMLSDVIKLHYTVLKPGGFLAINIGDILCFPDKDMPRIQANNVSAKRSITEEDAKKAAADHPDYNLKQLAEILGCSWPTVKRRLYGHDGKKSSTQTRVKLVGGFLEEMALDAGMYLYDRRVWVKDAAWMNCRWISNSYRSVDEFEYVYIFWKPGVTKVDRSRLEQKEWSEWGSRGVWNISSVRKNNDHEAKFPLELPRRVIKIFSEPGEIVLDCFMGSGTTAIAALDEGRHFIGIEKEKKYIKLSNANIEKYKQQGKQMTLDDVLGGVK